MGAAISSVLEANPDMVFLHQSPGLPADPKMYENPWTPEGGDVCSLMEAGGEIQDGRGDKASATCCRGTRRQAVEQTATAAATGPPRRGSGQPRPGRRW